MAEHSNPTVVVTGANGLVGAAVCRALTDRGATVRAVVRREGTAPEGVDERVGDFADPDFAKQAVDGADAVVTTVHPLRGDDDDQRRAAVEATPALARIAKDAGVPVLVHVSTAAVYERVPGIGDVDEHGKLVGDDAGTYAVTKRDADAALASSDLDGMTRILVRPPAILGSGETSVWNTLNPTSYRDGDFDTHVNPDKSFAWIHVDDLADAIAGLAVGEYAPSDDPEQGPVEGGCTPVNISAEHATQRDYLGTVGSTLGNEPTWTDEDSWTGRLRNDRARRWGWEPKVSLSRALEELAADVRRLM